MDNNRQPVIQDSDYRYVDKPTGKELTFHAKPDELMVTLQGAVEAGELNMIMRDSAVSAVSAGLNMDRGFAALSVDPGQDMHAAQTSLAAHPEVANSMPVLLDEHGQPRYFLPDEFTVQFKPDIDRTQAQRILRDHGSRVILEQRTSGYYTASVPEGKGLFQTIREFSELDEVAFSEPSEVGFNSADAFFPSNPDFGKLWGLHNTGQTVNGVSGIAGVDIQCPDAWDRTKGHPDVIIAIIDSGADLDHDDLLTNLLPRGAENWNFASLTDPVPEDDDGHGTHVAGTAAAGENAIGVIGVAPACRVMPLRVDLWSGELQHRVDAINFVTTRALANPDRRYIINCSWGIDGDHTGIRTAIQTAVNSNVIVVASAGKEGRRTDDVPHYLSCYPEVIAVAALNSDNTREQHSNYGTSIDVAAPGQNIWSSVLNNHHGFKSGTSMAAPHVAGIAGLVWSCDMSLTNQQVRDIIERTCEDVDSVNPGLEGLLGHGRANASAAVSSV
jgi:hypothetical protein